MGFDKTILITGGAGFIGSHCIRLFVEKYPNYKIINLDALTYAGNLENLKDVQDRENYAFVNENILNEEGINEVFRDYQVTDLIHLAAESHVDRSITDPLAFLKTNILGTANLLNSAKSHWQDSYDNHVFYHVSTDEVYGSLGSEGYFHETTAYDPQSPYSASKASSDHFVRAYANTYGLQVKISNCSNNYGPNQFPEKLIPLMLNNIRHNKKLPVYGDGTNVRDWLYVIDHARAIDTIFHHGVRNETYNIGGNNELQNIELVHLLCDLMDDKVQRTTGTSRELITFVKDRPGHDHRYAIDNSKLTANLGWEPSVTVEEGMRATIDWYWEQEEWMNNVTSGAYMDFYKTQYSC